MSILSFAHLFSSPPPPPRLENSETTLPPLPIPRRAPKNPLPKLPPKENHSRNAPPPPPSPALRSTHSRSPYYKPVPRPAAGVGDGGGERVVAADGDTGRAVVVGDSGVSYRLPGAPFEFRYSYSEAPKVRPLAMREPAFLPFGPPAMPRPWTGKAPLMSKKEKQMKKKKKIRLVVALGEEDDEEEEGRAMEMRGGKKVVAEMAGFYGNGANMGGGRSREEILGAPLTKSEIRALVKPHLSHNRQVNLGRDGLTHNMLELIHSHWRRQEVCKVRCRGVPTIDMDNVCYHLEEKTGGNIIHRIGGVMYLFRGRNYDHRTRPRYPVMLWKPAAPVYPKLIQEAPEGLTKVEADELRRKGQNLLPICKLAKNGIYINLVKDVRDAFEGSHLVKINCEGMHASDYKKLGAKLKELVPCVLLSFDQEEILIWRGKDWKSRYPKTAPLVSNVLQTKHGISSDLNDSGETNGTGSESITRKEVSSSKMLSLWKQAIDSQKALLLNETKLSPDSLLERVEEFESISQAVVHSYPAFIVSSDEVPDHIKSERSEIMTHDDNEESDCRGRNDEIYDDDAGDSLEEVETLVPFGSLPVDTIVKQLG